jgi:hypothetical protein
MFQVLRIAPSFVPDLPEPTGFAAKAQKIFCENLQNRGSRNTARAVEAREMAGF